MKSIEKVVIPVIIIIIVTILGCYYISKEYKKQQAEKRAQEIEAIVEENAANGGVVSKDELSYVTTAVLVGKNTEDGMLTLMSTENDRVFQAKYDGTTPFLGKHGNSLSLAQIPLGEILDVTYSVHSKAIDSAQVSSKAWTLTEVTKFEIDEKSGKMVIARENYKLPKKTIVSYGDQLAEMIDITNVDTLVVKGIDRRVCSIIVDRGHGYVRLLNDSYFVGGWIEIGQDIITPVSNDMLIPVPEGDYHVRLTNKGYAGEKDIEVERDKETSIDLSQIDIQEVAIGHVLFTIVPDYAQLHIDGVMTDFDDRVPLEYGIHRVHVELAGYESVDTSIKVSSEFADVSISLDKLQDSSSSTRTSSKASSSGSSGSSSSFYLGNTSQGSPTATSSSTAGSSTVVSTTAYKASSSSSNSTSSSSAWNPLQIISDSAKLYVEAPVGAEVYVDGNYIGICPVSVDKPQLGGHVITLAKQGYLTKSYTISTVTDGKDMTLSFSDLVPEWDWSNQNEYIY